MSKTELMCKAGLSSEQLHKYIPILSKSELLETSREEGRMVYTTTEKGKSFLQIFGELSKLLDQRTQYIPQTGARLAQIQHDIAFV